MRSAKAFVLGLSTAFLIDRVRAKRRGPDAEALDDTTIAYRVLGEALPTAGVSADDVDVEVEGGVVTLRGSVDGTERADALIQKVSEVPGVTDVAAMIRVSDRRAA